MCNFLKKIKIILKYNQGKVIINIEGAKMEKLKAQLKKSNYQLVCVGKVSGLDDQDLIGFIKNNVVYVRLPIKLAEVQNGK